MRRFQTIALLRQRGVGSPFREVTMMRIAHSLWTASTLALAVGSAPARADLISADNAFNVVQPTGAS